MSKTGIKYLLGLLLLTMSLAVFQGGGRVANSELVTTAPTLFSLYASQESECDCPAELNDEGCPVRPLLSRPRTASVSYAKAGRCNPSAEKVSTYHAFPYAGLGCPTLPHRATCDFLCTYRC